MSVALAEVVVQFVLGELNNSLAIRELFIVDAKVHPYSSVPCAVRAVYSHDLSQDVARQDFGADAVHIRSAATPESVGIRERCTVRAQARRRSAVRFGSLDQLEKGSPDG